MNGPMRVLKLGQNTSFGCKLKVLKAEPTEGSGKKLLGLKIGGSKIAPHMSGREIKIDR